MNLIKEIFRGILIGIANIIPGVSGGTMMVSMGIYDKIIGSITNLFHQFKKSILTLLPYVIGMGVGIVGLSFVIEYLFDKFPLPTALLFIGLIFGGLPVLLKKLKKGTEKIIDFPGAIIFLLFFALIIVLQLLGSNHGTERILTVGVWEAVQLFMIGILASATMVIPGVSGSMILMVLGFYNPIIKTINSFIEALASFDITKLLEEAGILVPFGLGIVIGIFAIAKIIEFLLKKFERLTYCAILGLVLASPIAVIAGIGVGKLNAGMIIGGILTFLFGFAGAYFLGRESK